MHIFSLKFYPLFFSLVEKNSFQFNCWTGFCGQRFLLLLELTTEKKIKGGREWFMYVLWKQGWCSPQDFFLSSTFESLLFSAQNSPKKIKRVRVNCQDLVVLMLYKMGVWKESLIDTTVCHGTAKGRLCKRLSFARKEFNFLQHTSW